MSRDLAKTTLTLKQFLVRGQVLKLYRNCFKTIQRIPDPRQRQDLQDWVRSDFQANKNIPPVQEERIQSLLAHGDKMLNELKQSVDLAHA